MMQNPKTGINFFIITLLEQTVQFLNEELSEKNGKKGEKKDITSYTQAKRIMPCKYNPAHHINHICGMVMIWIIHHNAIVICAPGLSYMRDVE